MKDKRILITGGTGTLGNVLVERLYLNNRITIYSRSEYLQAQMRQKYPDCQFVLGDVANYNRLHIAMVGHDIVIHAAAVKRIPEAEVQPEECIATNVIGSLNVVRACVTTGVERCVGISTDKACQAVTVYGASKLMMERIFQSQFGDICQFTLVRYGNVIQSRGSVVTVWRDMLEHDGYITSTDPNMSRFWMTREQAVDAVLLALGEKAGTVTIPMCSALSMRSFAEYVMPDAEFRYEGIRKNEKQHETLLTEREAQQAVKRRSETFDYWLLGDTVTGMANKSYTSDTTPNILTKDQLLGMLS